MRISDWSSDVCSSDLPQWRVDCVERGRCRGRLCLLYLSWAGWARRWRRCPAPCRARPGISQSAIGGLCYWTSPSYGNGTDSEAPVAGPSPRSEEHTSELQALMRISYAVCCLYKKTSTKQYSFSPTH